MLSPVRPSICPSQGWIIEKRLKLGLRSFHLTVAPSLYFLWGKFHPEILRGSPRAGASNKGGVGLSLSVNISKTVAGTAKVTMTNMKSHMGFPLTPRSKTSDDL